MTPDSLRLLVADVLANGGPLEDEMDAADEVLDAIPDGWAKVDGEWVQLEQVGAVDRDTFVSRTTDDEPLYGIRGGRA